MQKSKDKNDQFLLLRSLIPGSRRLVARKPRLLAARLFLPVFACCAWLGLSVCARPNPPAPAASQGQIVGQIIGNKRSHVYHVGDDGHLPGEKNRVYFATEAEAQKAGYRRSRTAPGGAGAAPAAIPSLPHMPGDAPSDVSVTPAPDAGPLTSLRAAPSKANKVVYNLYTGDKAGNYNLAAPLVPDPKLTPGAALPVTVADIAVPGYTHKVRNVPKAVKEQVYAEYGIKSRRPGEYEIDHLISLELGGSNSIRNLWPESYKTHPLNARVKDRLENRMHELVVSGQLDLTTAQREEAADWVGAYRKYVGPLPTTRK